MTTKNLLRTMAIAAALFATPALAQSAAELRAQIREMRANIARGEAAGMDASVLQTFRDAADELEQSLREEEASQASSASSSPPPPATPAYPVRPNVLEAGGACRGFTLDNYRERALAGGSDVQLNTMCGQAYEYYAMYLRAISQGYSEADANRTYAAFEKAAANATSFYQSAR